MPLGAGIVVAGIAFGTAQRLRDPTLRRVTTSANSIHGDEDENASRVAQDRPERAINDVALDEAGHRLDKSPDLSTVQALFPRMEFRDRCYAVALRTETALAVRVWVLSRFADQDSNRALSLARRLLSRGDIETPLRVVCLEVLSRHGDRQDVDFFKESPFEDPFHRRFRIAERDRLIERTGGVDATVPRTLEIAP
jgi:hypothetical protein